MNDRLTVDDPVIEMSDMTLENVVVWQAIKCLKSRSLIKLTWVGARNWWNQYGRCEH